MSGAVFDVRERLRWMLDENTCNISPRVAEGARGALEILDCWGKEIASLKESIAEYQRLEQEGLLVRVDCEGCKHNSLYDIREWEKSKCKICARNNYTEWDDNFEVEATNGAE